jgi:snurportin-1
VLATFQSALPGGSRRQRGGGVRQGGRPSENYCILDCVLDRTSNTFYVLDLMCWRGYLYYDCDLEFRRFWAQSKFAEECSAHIRHAEHNPYPLVVLPHQRSDPAGLRAALTAHVPYQRQCLLLYHSQTYYHLGGSCPLMCTLSLHDAEQLVRKAG